MKTAVAVVKAFLFANCLAACSSAPPLPEIDDNPPSHEVRVLNNGWHTAIVVNRSEVVAAGLLPEAEDFPDAAFLEFGWGDRTYYPAKEKTFGMTLGAALIGTPAIMHVAGRAANFSRMTANGQIVALTLTEGGFRRMMRAIAGDFQRPETGRAEPVARGLYPASFFYHAHGSFHLFNTCNNWTARMLRAGGIAISPSGIVTADNLITRLRAALSEHPGQK